MKYVTTKKNEVILFSETIKHSSVCFPDDADSAGFFSINQIGENGPDRVHCYGESITLDLVSKPERDQDLIELALYGFERVSQKKDNETNRST